MLLNDTTVFVGDRVFDISAGRGYGNVSRITDTHIEVKFSTISVRYDNKGIQLNRDWQTLFWDKPLIIQPEKEERAWAAKRKLIEEFYSLVAKYKDYV
jgi:hypothetical protein